MTIESKSICIDASTVCQLKCRSCPTANGETGKSLGRGFLRFEDFKELVDKNPLIYDIELSNWGEVFLNKELLQMIKYAYTKGVRLSAENGANMNNIAEDIPEALVRYKFRKITCSLDGACQETYSAYRVNGDFEQVMKNIKKINRFKEKYNSFHPILQWQFIPFGHNEHEIDKARKMAKELNMIFKLKLSWDDFYTEAFSPVKNPEIVRKINSRGVASRKEFREVFGRDYVSNVCLRLWSKPRINYDGRLLGCSLNYRYDYGNVFKDGIDTCLNGEKAEYAREMLMGKRKELPGIPCSQCKIYEHRKENENWVTNKDIEKVLGSYNGTRSSVKLKNRLLRFRAVNRFIQFSDDRDTDKSRHYKEKVRGTDIQRSGKSIPTSINQLSLPIKLSGNMKWKPHPLFKGMTRGNWELSCHASALAPETSPHAPHKHVEEELLLLLSGSAKLILPDNKDSGNNGNIDLEAGQFVYYPSYFPHTLFTTGAEPANYMMFRWTTNTAGKDRGLGFGRFDLLKEDTGQKSRFSTLVFEGPTLYLQKLHCHRTLMKPGKGYDAHADDYDVAIVVLDGEVETLGKRAKPYDVIFYSSGEPHGMRNPANKPSRYIVFEFHTKKFSAAGLLSDRISSVLHNLVDRAFWKRKLKRWYGTLLSLFFKR